MTIDGLKDIDLGWVIPKESIIDKADEIYIPTVELSKRLAFKALENVVTTYCPLYGPEKRYLRRIELVPAIFNVSDYYHRDMADRIIQRYLPHKGGTPFAHLQAKVAERDPIALKVAAILLLLSESEPKTETEVFTSIPLEQGRISIQSLSEFTINGDKIAVLDIYQTVVKTYTFFQRFSISEPDQDSAVTYQYQSYCVHSEE